MLHGVFMEWCPSGEVLEVQLRRCMAFEVDGVLHGCQPPLHKRVWRRVEIIQALANDKPPITVNGFRSTSAQTSSRDSRVEGDGG